MTTYLGRVSTARVGVHVTRHAPHIPRRAPAGLVERGEQLAGMPAAIAAEEVRSRSAAANELDVDVSRLADDVAKKPSVAIDVVEGPIPLELHRCARRRQALELALRLTREALALAELGSVDLDEPHALPASHVERVPVADTLHDGASARSSAGRRRAPGERQRPAVVRRRLGSDGRKLVDAGALRLFLAIHSPGDEEQPAEDDHESRTQAGSEPDPIEDHNAEHPEEKERDRRTRQLEAVARHAASL